MILLFKTLENVILVTFNVLTQKKLENIILTTYNVVLKVKCVGFWRKCQFLYFGFGC